MAFSILVSMIVSFTLTPMLSSRWLTRGTPGAEPRTRSTIGCSARSTAGTARSLRWTLAHPMRIIGISAALVALTLPLNRMVGRTFVPAEDMNEFTVHADTPQGTSIEGTAEIARNLVKEVGEHRGRLTTGLHRRRRSLHALPPSLLPAALERAEGHAGSDHDAGSRRAGAPSLHTLQASWAGIRWGGGGNFAIQAALLGPDLGSSTRYSQQIVEQAKQTPSLVDAKSDYSDASPEVQVAVDRSRAADLGVRMATIGNTLRLMVAGDDEITTYREAGEQYPVTVRVLESQRRDIDKVGKLTVLRRRASQCGSTTSRGWNEDSVPLASPARTGSIRSTCNADIAPGHALDESSNDSVASSTNCTCRRATASRCRGRRRTSTRPPTT